MSKIEGINEILRIRWYAGEMKNGFTLVELSIVLVIIGLLIGGILVGQSLIDSVQINRLVSDLRQYEVAINTFYKKFKKYPGDSRVFIPPGDGDSMLGNGANGPTSCAVAPNQTLSNNETYQFWAHLSQAQMLKTNYPAFSDLDSCGGIHSMAELIAGKITPSKKSNPIATLNYFALESGQVAIMPYKATADASLAIYSIGFPMEGAALGKKLGGMQLYDGQAIQKPGLKVENCTDYDYNSIDCNNPDAVGALFYYFLAPQ